MQGLFIGQAVGRWGNFINVEAFGGNTDGLFGMGLHIATFGSAFVASIVISIVSSLVNSLIGDK